MKTINAKIPISKVELMSDNGHLNPSYMEEFISALIHTGTEVSKQPIKELTFHYSFKGSDDLWKDLKLKAIEKGLPMNELIGRLIVEYYQ